MADETELPASDYMLPFLLDNLNTSGRIVNLSKSVTETLAKHNYPDNISQLLGELMIFAVMLGSSLKTTGILTIQVKNTKGSLKFLVADYSYNGDLRAYASFAEELLLDNTTSQNLIDDGYITITLDLGENTQKYQGIVKIEGNSLTKSIQEYMQSSQQLASIIKINLLPKKDGLTTSWQANGILLQQLPVNEEHNDLHITEDNWQKLRIYVETITDNELAMVNNTAIELLQNLFHEEKIYIFDYSAIRHKCRCSRDRMQTIIDGMSAIEKDQIIAEYGIIEVTCQFCNKIESFNHK